MDEGKVVLTTQEYMQLVERANLYQSVFHEVSNQIAEISRINTMMCGLERRIYDLEHKKI